DEHKGDAGIPKDKQPGGPEVRDCRTFSNGELHWVLSSEVADTADGFESKWVIDTKPGKASIDNAEIDKHAAKAGKDGKLPKVDGFVYEVPVSVGVPGSGFVVAARFQGQLDVAKRQGNLEPAGKPTQIALGA